MTMQRLCHECAFVPLLIAVSLCAVRAAIADEPPVHDYPTLARVEFVQECMARHGSKGASLYQCSCAIDRIANRLSYDDFVEASTFAKYATLPGDGGAIFRDSEQAQKLAKMYRQTEADAYRSCGLGG